MLVHSRGLARFDSLLSWIDCNVASTSSSLQLGRYSTSVFHVRPLLDRITTG